MKITKIEVLKNFVRLEQPLSISFHTFHFSEIFYVKISADNGRVGWGEGAPFEPITGDNEAMVRSELKILETFIGRTIDQSVDGISQFTARIKSRTLMAAVDFALHDLVAQSRRVPVYQLYRSSPHIVPNCVTVFIKESIAESSREAERIYAAYPDLRILKIKLKGEGDYERCSAIKSVSPAGMHFVLDANQGFADPAKAVTELNRIIEVLGEVVLIEEPCKKHDFQSAAIVRKHIQGSKIVADESCCHEKDLEQIVATSAFDGINIKLQKAGGIQQARRLAEVARAHDLVVMVGQMFESALSTAASLVVANVCDNVVLTDLDMDLDLPDFCVGKTPFNRGSREPLESAGFGFSLKKSESLALETSGVLVRDLWASFA